MLEHPDIERTFQAQNIRVSCNMKTTGKTKVTASELGGGGLEPTASLGEWGKHASTREGNKQKQDSAGSLIRLPLSNHQEILGEHQTKRK